MKKILSIIMIVVMLLLVINVPAFATTTINATLQEHLDIMNDENLIWVWIWIRSSEDTEAMGNQAVIDKIGASEENIYFLSEFSPSFIVQLTKKQIEYAVTLDEVVGVYYYTTTESRPGDIPTLYKDKFIEEFEITDIYDIGAMTYEEHHYFDLDDDGNIDYAVIYAHEPYVGDSFDYKDLGERYLECASCYSPISCAYALYDVEKDVFVSFSKDMLIEYTFMVDYLNDYSVGTPYGDADGDNELTIMDATEIQLGLAGLAKTNNWMYDVEGVDDYLYGDDPVYRSDIDRDSEVTVLDATMIQLKLAMLL